MDLLNGGIDELARLAYEQDAEKIRKKLQEIVPEYKLTNDNKEGESSDITAEGRQKEHGRVAATKTKKVDNR